MRRSNFRLKETDVMSKQDNCETNIQQESLADLPLTAEQAEQTRAGAQLAGEGKKVVIDFCKTDVGHE